MKKVLNDRHGNDLLPTEMVADTAYESDDNFCRCKIYGVEISAPVPGKSSEQKGSGEVFADTDFPFEEREVIDGYGKTHINPFITSCPAGLTPHRSQNKHTKTINVKHKTPNKNAGKATTFVGCV